jgi:hypothetical protein
MITLSVVTPLKVAALALVAMLAVACDSAATHAPTAATSLPKPATTVPKPAATKVPKPATSTPKPATSAPKPLPSPSPPRALVCTTSAAKGGCGPYDNYSEITGTTSSTYVGNNVWNPIPGWHQTLYATDPGKWHVTARLPAGNTAVVSYPSVGANYGRVTDLPTPLTNYSSIYSSFSENMNATARTSAWAAYDIWLGPDKCSPAGSDCASDEVMIQHDFANNGACTTLATAAFGGSGGVPVQKWHLCKYGSELIWKLTRNEQSGSVDILSMLTWLVNHRYLPVGTGLWLIGYGWEICSTGGVNENFQVSRYSITPARSSRASLSSSRS